MKYIVSCTKISNGTLEIEANSKEEAIEYAKKHIDEVIWIFGEATADYAEEDWSENNEEE